MSAIQEIAKFQTERQLEKQPYVPSNEAMNTIEEVLESMGWDIPKTARKRVLEPMLEIIKQILRMDPECKFVPVTWEDQADAHCDQIVFAIGALMKMGLNPERALTETALEINSRKGEMSNGKFEKYLGRKYTDQWYKADYKKAIITQG